MPETPARSLYTYDTLQIGDSHSFTRTISAEDVRLFAQITGDDNPIHLDEAFARSSRFGKPIVHGVLLMGIISKVLGRDFPGYGSVAVSMFCRFLRPVPVGAEITVEVKISEKIEKHKHVKARVYIYHAGKIAIGGDATFIPPLGEDAPADEPVGMPV